MGTASGACGTPGRIGCSDTWEWDGNTWTDVTPATSPSAREYHALTHDAARGVTVLFGGFDNTTGACGTTGSFRCGDTWEWDGNTWTDVTPATSPPARSRHALAYDTARGVTVLFGGSGVTGSCGAPNSFNCSDTWEWNGHTWNDVTPATPPPARERHALAHDAERGVTVLFGGINVATGTCDTPGLFRCTDTWEWDGVNWTDVTPANSPPLRERHALAYDAARGATVLFGGEGTASGACGTPGSSRCSDTWEWNGHNWTQRTPAGSPPARGRHALAYDTSRSVTVLFGGLGVFDSCGTTGSNRCSDTQEWNGANWTDVTPAHSPPIRASHALAYDTARGVTVLFGGIGTNIGGCGTSGSFYCSDTWEWNGHTWTEVPSATSPPARGDHALAYDADRGVTILFGGIGPETETSPWGPTGTTVYSDTWEWDGIAWTEVYPTTSPPARGDHALAYDAARGVTVLFGGAGTAIGTCGTPGSDRCSDTWEWNGNIWTDVTTAHSPPARNQHALAYDAARGATVLFGGRGTSVAACGTPSNDRCSDTWQWDGASWTEVTPSNSPPARQLHGLAYDATRDVTVLFGGGGGEEGACGTPGTTLCSDTWFLASNSPLSPRHTFIPAFAPALAPDATLRTVTARWIVGGSGTPGGNLTEGAELLVWDGLGWTVLDTHAAGPDTPAALCTRLVADESTSPDPGCTDLVDPALVNRLFRFGPDLTSTFAVRPTAPIGTDQGALRSEDVAVTVRYRLPGE